MRKSFLLTAALGALITASLAFTHPPRYKNLKVLPKNTTKQQMDSVMHHFTAALGVKCNFCHTYNKEQKSMDFASDANPHKDMAREMMKMTAKINKKYFDVQNTHSMSSLTVSCYTCHGGKAEPAVVPERQVAQH